MFYFEDMPLAEIAEAMSVPLKIWFWMEIQRNSVVREIKRLELQVANLSRQLDARK